MTADRYWIRLTGSERFLSDDKRCRPLYAQIATDTVYD